MNVKNVTKILSIAGGIFLLCIFLITILTYLRIPIGINFFSVQTGSMAPSINEGSFIVTMKVPTYHIGDIITYESIQSGEKVPITHRIIDTNENQGNTYIQTKGDANTAPDVDLVLKKDIIGKVFIRIPLIGYIFSFTRTPAGFLLMIALPAGVIICDEIRTIFNETKKLKKK